MKQVSLIINIVLAVALAVLYYFHFSNKTPKEQNQDGATAAIGDLKIAYINSDTVLKYYDYFKVNREKLEAKGKQMDTDFRNRAQGLQREITSYQNSAGNLTRNQAMAVEEDLAKKQQNLRVYQESLSQELAIEENKLNQELYQRVTAYLKEYGAREGIHAVFKYDVTSDVLFANNTMDITQQVITGLNDAYKNNIPSSDSTQVKK